jgi:hypothetical protein
MRLGKLEKLFEFFLRRVRLDSEIHPDVFKAISDAVRQPERAAKIKRSFQARFDLLYLDALGGGLEYERCRQASGQRVQDVLDGVGRAVFSHQCGRLVSVNDEGLHARRVFPASPV